MVPHKNKIVTPRILSHVQPGELPANMLVDVKPFGKLLYSVAPFWHAWRDHAFACGITKFKPTSPADCYRSIAVQRAAWFSRMTTEPIDGVEPRLYMGKMWYLRPGYAPIAQPGRSNHNLGISVDVAHASGERLAFMVETAGTFGWSWELDSEPWHVNCFNVDRVPPAVAAWIASKPL